MVNDRETEKERVGSHGFSERMPTEAGALSAAVPVADRLWKVLIIAILYCLLFREELKRLLDLWSTANESHGFLIPLFSLYFLYRDRVQLKQAVGRPSFWGAGVILCSLAVYLYVGAFQGFYYARQIMMIFLLAGVVLLLGGWRIFRIVWLPIFYLWFAMPLPSRLYTQITMPMREWGSSIASLLLNVMPGIHCNASGVLIHGVHAGEPFSLNVADACSGMRLLMAFLALGVAMAYLEYRPAIHRILLLCSTIPIAIFCNILRVLLTGFIHIYIGPEYATGLLHTLLGIVMLGVAFGLYGLLAWIMNNLVVEEDAGQILIVGQNVENPPLMEERGT